MSEYVHILIVEDSKTQATEIKHFLVKSGYDVSVCYDGEEAWTFMQKQEVPPSLVISDIIMPKMDGYELCGKIRQHEKFSNVMVMLLTALTEPTDIIKGLKSLADSFLIKPYNKNFLLGRIGQLLEYRSFIKEMPTDMGLAIDFFGQRQFLTSNRVQVINNLLSVHDTVEVQSIDLKRALEAETRLKESEERYKTLFERSLECVFIYDFDGNFIDANEASLNLIGYDRKDLPSLNLASLLSEDQFPLTIQVYKELKKAGHQKRVAEFRLKHKIGGYVDVETQSAVIYRDGKPSAIQGIARDITERKKYQDTIRKSEEKYRSFVQNFQGIAYKANLITWTPIFFHGEVEEITGYSEDELINGSPSWNQVIHPEDIEKLTGKEEFQCVPHYSIERDYRIIRKDGNVRWVHELSRNICDESGKPVEIEGTIIDITARKQTEDENTRLEAKYRQAQKMEFLGLLAGGVAHDLNNVLSGIVSYPELILMNLPEDSNLRKPLETMMESGLRASAIVQDLLIAARGVATPKEPMNLNDQVSGYLNSPEFKKLKQFYPIVTVKTDLDTDLLNIGGSHVHIRKMVMNLVANAAESIKGRGNVMISTVNRYIDKPLKGYNEVDIGEYAVLSVSDDGSGISSDDLERIFEPFYTKKMMGRSGTGLGLTVVWNTVQDHNGYIDVKSDQSGTKLQLYFPITRDEISKKDLSIPIRDYMGNGETILVVDDEEKQREISCKILDTLGYKCEAVSSGEAAIEYLQNSSVDLLLLDMIMDPGLNGRETYESIIKIHPYQKAIIVSGYSATDDVKNTQKLGAGKYIKKPFTLEKIGLAVKEELEK